MPFDFDQSRVNADGPCPVCNRRSVFSSPAAGAAHIAKEAVSYYNWLRGLTGATVGPAIYKLSPADFENVVTVGQNTAAASELGLVKAALPWLRENVPPGLELVDLGPGGPQAVTRRACRIATAIHASRYHPIDISEVVLDAALRTMAKARQGLPAVGLLADFLHEVVQLPPAAARFVYIDGSTIGNLGVPNLASFPLAEYTQLLTRLRWLTGPEGLLLIGWDASSTEKTATERYKTPEGSRLFKTPLRVLAQEFGVDGIDPDNWVYRPIWHPESHCVSHELICKRPVVVRFAGERFAFWAGDSRTVVNSFKIQPEIMQRLAARTQFKVVYKDQRSDGHRLWLLQAA